MSKHYIGCPKCCSFASFSTESKAHEMADSHNESRHENESIARVIEPESKDSLNDFMDKAKELAKRKQYERLVRRYTREKTPFKKH